MTRPSFNLPTAFLCVFLCAGAVAAAVDDVWTRSIDPAARTRYIPVEFILGARWDGQREIKFPSGTFTEGVDRNPSTWRGPSEWVHPDTGAKLIVYDRARRG